MTLIALKNRCHLIRPADLTVHQDTSLMLHNHNQQIGIVELMEHGLVNIKFAKVW